MQDSAHPEQREFELNYCLEQEDLLALNRQFGAGRLPQLTVAVAMFFGLIALPTLARGSLNSSTLTAFIPLTVFILFLLAIPVWQKNAVRLQIKTVPFLLEDRTLRLSAEGVDVQSPGGINLTRWVALTKVVEAKQHVYLFTSPRSAHIVPKRAFATPAAAGLFAEAARRYWAEAHGDLAEPPAGGASANAGGAHRWGINRVFLIVLICIAVAAFFFTLFPFGASD